jgi:hypothetical protein
MRSAPIDTGLRVAYYVIYQTGDSALVATPQVTAPDGVVLLEVGGVRVVPLFRDRGAVGFSARFRWFQTPLEPARNV